MNRSTQEVFEDHLHLAAIDDLETDIKRNHSEEVVLLTSFGVFRGHAGVREAADLLAHQVPGAHYIYRTRLTHEEMAFLEWSATSEQARVEDGADSFLIRHGRIQMMTIHYTVIEKGH